MMTLTASSRHYRSPTGNGSIRLSVVARNAHKTSARARPANSSNSGAMTRMSTSLSARSSPRAHEPKSMAR